MGHRWLPDVSAAEWIAGALHPFGQDTGSVVPEGFVSYARLFHPVRVGEHPQRWADIARRNGRIVHPEMQLHMIDRPLGSPPPRQYHRGEGFSTDLPADACALLVGVLREATITPDQCWFCVWAGYGDVDDQGVAERVELPSRTYLLAAGAIEKAVPDSVFDRPPNIWWPENREWVVVTEIDFAWTYIGGSNDLIGTLLAEPRLEVLPARLGDKPFYDSDLLNGALDLSPPASPDPP
jgi:hypothetical protein